MSAAGERVLIVGAGPAGLAAAAALSLTGVDALVLERDARIGDGWRRRYDRLHLHTARAFSGLPFRGMPRSFPRYVPRDLYAGYLETYARDLRLRVQTSTRVDRVARADGRWTVRAGDATWSARAVVLAMGRFGAPVLPSWAGREAFAGRVVHSSAYRNGSDFAGGSVLVVGAGNSGTEIATDLVQQRAARVVISVRSGVFVSRRDVFGLPLQLFGIALMPLPPAIADGIGRAVNRVVVGDLSRFGLRPAPASRMPFRGMHVPIIDVGFLAELRRGRIVVRPDVARFTPSGIVFADGREERFDAVVAATGFRPEIEDVLDLAGVLDEQGLPRDRSGDPTRYPGLYFLGYTSTPRGVLFEANRDARRLARVVAVQLSRAA